MSRGISKGKPSARSAELDALCRAGYIPGDRKSETAFLRTNRQFHLTIEQIERARRMVMDGICRRHG